MRELEGPAQREIAAMDFGRTTLAAAAGVGAKKKGSASQGAGASDSANSTPEGGASAKHAEKLSNAERKAEEVDEAAEESRMAARDSHLLRNSMVFRANLPSSVQPHNNKEFAIVPSTHVANPLNGSEASMSAPSLPPPPPPTSQYDHQHSSAAVEPGAPAVKNQVSFSQQSMGDDGQQLVADFTDV